MPTVLILNGFRFYFFSNEGNEPVHIHISRGDANAKYWLEPIIDEAYSYGFTITERKFILLTTQNKYNTFIKAWYEFFNRYK